MDNLEKFIMYVGLNDKNTKKQEIKTKTAKSTIADICGNCTISDGTQVKEKTLKVELLFTSYSEVTLQAQKIKEKLNQETIVIEKQIINSVLV